MRLQCAKFYGLMQLTTNIYGERQQLMKGHELHTRSHVYIYIYICIYTYVDVCVYMSKRV